MKIERKKYLDELISLQNNGMIKIITGIRRCGKSDLPVSYTHLDVYKRQLYLCGYFGNGVLQGMNKQILSVVVPH